MSGQVLDWPRIKVMRFKDGGLVIATGDQDPSADNVELYDPVSLSREEREKREAVVKWAESEQVRAEQTEAERAQAAQQERKRIREALVALERDGRIKLSEALVLLQEGGSSGE